uniref:Transcriptional regulator n=2 Tax=Hapalosiphonaceae TaxID=1892263 RepID=A0A075X5U1_9CYAN|nr:WelR2 [Hapalosiphon welwitschii UTEX B 1830]AIH14790.1 transcriptional regulator [Westiella intricata UH HT-29-1]
MTKSLQSLFQLIAKAKDEQELKSQISAEVGEYFAAKRWRLLFFNQLPSIYASFQKSNFQKALQLGLSTKHNPVLCYLVERHAPVHEGLLVSPKTWRLICPRTDHWHVMAGPIVSNGKLVGMVALTREKGMPPFNIQNLADLSALCLHLSTWVATVNSQTISISLKPSEQTRLNSFDVKPLTPREVEISELVARGFTNAEIGKALGIQENSVKQALKRMFRKLEVSSRAEMVAKLSSFQFSNVN